jgi:hypothetical protein
LKEFVLRPIEAAAGGITLDNVFLWGATIVNAPLHILVVLSGIFLVMNNERRHRMGLVGAVHVSASVIAVLSSYWLLVPLLVEFSQSQLIGGNESSALHHQQQQLNKSVVLSSLINGISTAVSTISSVGLMWMIPASIKKYARLFACSSITCLSIAFTQLDFF